MFTVEGRFSDGTKLDDLGDWADITGMILELCKPRIAPGAYATVADFLKTSKRQGHIHIAAHGVRLDIRSLS